MAKPTNGTIIIKRVKKAHPEAHHGGAWKVAYADFVTAMMAFFLLLWLLNVTTDVQKRGIADYFDPTITIREVQSGANGLLGGAALGKPGNMTEVAAAPSLSIPIPALRQPDEGDEGDDGGTIGKATDANDGLPGSSAPTPPKAIDLRASKLLAAKEDKQFAAAEFALRQAIQDIPELHNLADNLIIDRTPEGLRIQIVDQDKLTMFPLGSSEMNAAAKKLMALVAQVVQKLPNKISVTGHTDATPYLTGNYTNWELSTDRANASRRELLRDGLPAERIAKVIGMADREPLVADDPNSPRNRRISIVLLREAKPAAPSKLAQR